VENLGAGGGENNIHDVKKQVMFDMEVIFIDEENIILDGDFMLFVWFWM